MFFVQDYKWESSSLYKFAKIFVCINKIAIFSNILQEKNMADMPSSKLLLEKSAAYQAFLKISRKTCAKESKEHQTA